MIMVQDLSKESMMTHLLRYFDEGAVSRGVAYARKGAVRSHSFKLSGGTLKITAIVKGTGKYVYESTVTLDTQSMEISGHCSCPVRRNCKHCAASYLICMSENDFKELSLKTQKSKSSPLVESFTPLDLDEPLHDTFESLFVAGENQQEHSDVFCYLISLDDDGATYQLRAGFSKKLKSGYYSKPKVRKNINNYFSNRLAVEDKRLLGELNYLRHEYDYDEGSTQCLLSAKNLGLVFKSLVQTGHCYWGSMQSTALHWGEPVEGKLIWQMQANGNQKPIVTIVASCDAIMLDRHYYYDASHHRVGPIDTHEDAVFLAKLFQMPELKPTQVKAFSRLVKKHHASKAPMAMPTDFDVVKPLVVDPVPQLYVYIKMLEEETDSRNYFTNFEKTRCIVAEYKMQYDNVTIDAGYEHARVLSVEKNELIDCQRNLPKEKEFLALLNENGLVPFYMISNHFSQRSRKDNIFEQGFYLGDADVESDLADVDVILQALSKKGWVIHDDTETLQYGQIAIDDWYTDLDEASEYNWFKLDTGVIINGEKISLLPLLLSVIKGEQSVRFDGSFHLDLGGGKKAVIPAARVELIKKNLLQYLSPKQYKKGEILIRKNQAALIAQMKKAMAASKMRWFGGERFIALGQQLAGLVELKVVDVPTSFKAILRPYQQVGVNWLGFLSEYGFNGLLADDMGLGKTLQALAHLTAQRIKDQAHDPALIIAPTSVVPNWESEIARFTPHFKVLVWHGSDRKKLLSHWDDADIILTSYPLLTRDNVLLTEKQFDTIILDEAHYIKNKSAKITQIAQQLNAHMRICLTGTPLENNLSELWSQFNFLMPGMLGNHREFVNTFQRPIEKWSDEDAQASLNKIVKPFLMRRTKDEVELDLPSKTEMVQHVNIAGGQRDFYETIRLAMDKKIRKAIDEKGIERSHIIILDALLKLRQICCDPSLVKIPDSHHHHNLPSAKRQMLIEMLQKMLPEGRRILLFSQFTSMLSLIEDDINALGIDYVKITGKTKNRKAAINAFQNGSVPLFLISLKAGGVGLNLTAADVVIHYDPWWNPAAEMQATDRAHRIGQDKPVFVYKLITKDTIEEKIMEMQNKKKAIADALFSDGKTSGKLTAADFKNLFSA